MRTLRHRVVNAALHTAEQNGGATCSTLGNLAAMDTVPTDPTVTAGPLDLDGIERDLADVEVALTRLDAGTYWADEVTGEELSAELLAEHPTARRAPTQG